ncbi:PadR family transcriptional regulator [Glaciihabitans tibetensis]|uniref:PadR family transcriptional regulator n=1 Tax=Glaciihabitans tibetensis TaxID=1266600 RepID=A0A2T0V4E7_9MICO|nr:PadR family transcriptional regulator [Glaciihabitans tibetensis]PRY65024.1 PadR family transcriptional regulator [Glaciihabitans tibetensis]
MVRRKPGTLFPLEVQILESGIALQRENGDFYGFALAKRISSDNDKALMAGHGTLYKALTRMAEAGLLASSWEDSDIAEAESRPRRRLYQVTGEGVRALDRARALIAAPEATKGVSLA